MVCIRCKMAVRSVLEALNLAYTSIELGKVELKTAIDKEMQKRLEEGLAYYHLELLESRKKILVERIKTIIIELFQSSQSIEIPLKFSEYLSKQLSLDYTYMANTFSEMEGSTIERFYITTRIERVKELVVYESLSLKEIAYQLNYSSVSHLCLQFKKVTGVTPSRFKKQCIEQDYVWRTCE